MASLVVVLITDVVAIARSYQGKEDDIHPYVKQIISQHRMAVNQLSTNHSNIVNVRETNRHTKRVQVLLSIMATIVVVIEVVNFNDDDHHMVIIMLVEATFF